MKIAVLADIHSNHIALLTAEDHITNWKPDFVVVVGDLINRGPDPLKCINLIKSFEKSENWIVFRGNHEDYVVENYDSKNNLTEFELDVHQPSLWTAKQIGLELSYIRQLKTEFILTSPDGRNLHFVHGSTISNRDGIYPDTSDIELEKKIFGNTSNIIDKVAPAVFCVGHTHRPLRRFYKNCMVINAGSIGLPFDGDNRLSYAQLIWDDREQQWHSRIIRLTYDLDRAENRFYTTGYLDKAGPLSRIVLTELRTAQSLLYYWAENYRQSVFKGLLPIEESVNMFLEKYVGEI